MRYDLLFEAEPFNAEADFEWEGEVSRRSAAYIRWVQQSLNQILGLRLAVDGDARVLTRSAIRSFQQKNGLVVDGDVGPITEAALIAAGAPPPPGASTAPTPTGGANQRLDAGAQQSLQRMLASKFAPVAGQAQAMLKAATGEGALGGVVTETHNLAGQLAERLGVGRRQLFPRDADAVAVMNPARASAPALVVFREEIRNDPKRLDIALLKAWSSVQKVQKLPADLRRAAQQIAARGRTVSEAEFSLTSLWEDVIPVIVPIVTSRFMLSRPLAQSEIDIARPVFGTSLDFGRVVISPLGGFEDRPFTQYIPSFDFVSNFPMMLRSGITALCLGEEAFSNHASTRSADKIQGTLIHELVHSWQSQHHPIPWEYETNSVASQALAAWMNANSLVEVDAYCYSANNSFESYAAEQIAQSVENRFLLKDGSHQQDIVAHISSMAPRQVSTPNVMSLAFPRVAAKAGPTFCSMS